MVEETDKRTNKAPYCTVQVMTRDGINEQVSHLLIGIRQGLQRWTPDAQDTPAPLVFYMIAIWRITRVVGWVLVGQKPPSVWILTSFVVQFYRVQRCLKKVIPQRVEQQGCKLETSDLQSFSCHVSCVGALKQLLLRLKETKEQSNTVSKRAPGLPHSLWRAHRSLSSLLPSLYLSSHLSALCSAFWAEFKHWGPV